MYGLWLYKEIATEYGACRIEIHQRDYQGDSMEIDAIAANSIVLATFNLSELTSPIQKTKLSFSIIDTKQFDYSLFFTPDAKKYKVILKTRKEEQNYITRWTGYLTPDSYVEELQYRSCIDLIARDNIGLLNELQFNYQSENNNTVASIRDIILTAFKEIDDNYPMQLLFKSEKTYIGNDEQNSILLLDCMINYASMIGETWCDVLELLLHDFGLQLRYIDNNRLAIYDLSQLSDLCGDAEGKQFVFLKNSGIKEIMPAWKEVNIEQNYGVINDFYVGQINDEGKISYVKPSSFNYNISLWEPTSATQWTRENDIYLLNFLNVLNNYIDDNKINSLYITGISPTVDNDTVANNKLIYTQRINSIDKQITISFTLNDTLREPNDTVYIRGNGNSYLYLPYGNVGHSRTPLTYQLKYRFNIYLIGNDGNTYVMREKWINISDDNENFIEFVTDILKRQSNNVTGSGAGFVFSQVNNEKEFKIIVNTIPVDGYLQFVIYPYTFENDSYINYRDDKTFERGAKISNIKFVVETDSKGLQSTVLVNNKHNLREKINLKLGEVPANQGDFLLYRGGVFYPNTLKTVNGFKLPNRGSSAEYHLLELVNREIIHYNRENCNLLSGCLSYGTKEPIRFNVWLNRNDKKFILRDASLDVISNELNIISAQEIDDYVDSSFTQINSPISSGSGNANVGGGNNTVFQFSSDAGNAKRVYELDEATEADLQGASILVDKQGLSEAKKYSLEKISELLDWFTLRNLDDGSKALVTRYNLVSELGIAWGGIGSGSGGGGSWNRLDSWDNYDASAGDVLSAVLGYDLKTQIEALQSKATAVSVSPITTSGSHIASITVDETTYRLYAPKTDLTGYAKQSWVEDKGYAVADDVAKTYATITALSALQASHDELRTDFDALDELLNSDTSGVIDTWHEVVAFLDGYSESQDLASILSAMNTDIASRAKQAALDALAVRVSTNEDNIATQATAIGNLTKSVTDNSNNISALDKAIKAIQDWFELKTVNGTTVLYTKYNLASEFAIAWGGMGDMGGGGSGLIERVYGYNSLGGTFDNNVLTDTFNAYTINRIASRVTALESKATNVSISNLLSQGTLIGRLAIDNTSYNIYAPTIPTKVSAFTNDAKYLTSITSAMVTDALGYTPVQSIPTTLPNPYALTFGNKSYNGSSAKTITAGDLGALTAHQAIYALTIKDSAGAAQVTYTPNSAAASLTLAKSMVGLGNVDNTADNAKYVKGVIDYGDTNYTIKIGLHGPALKASNANYLAAYGADANGEYIIKDINKTEAKSWLGLRSLAYRDSLAFSELTGKPTTIAGYGITDAYTSATVDSKLSGYLPLSGGTMTGQIIMEGASVLGVDSGTFYLGSPYYPVALRSNGTTKLNGYDIIHSGNIVSHIANAGNISIGGHLSPSLAHTYTLGTSTLTWNVVYTRYIDTYSDYDLRFRTGGTEQMRLAAASGCLILGNSSTTDDSTYKLNVIGNGRFSERLKSASLTTIGYYANIQAKGWYRVFTSDVTNSSGKSQVLLNVGNSYSYDRTCIYQFSITVGYNGAISISQLSGVKGSEAITKIRVDWVNSDLFYIDIYINSASFNQYTVSGIGNGAFQAPTSVASPSGSTYEFTTTTGSKLKGNLVVTGSITFGSASDRRLKDCIQQITDVATLDVLTRLNPVSFAWNATAKAKDAALTGYSVGFIADEYENIIKNSGRDIYNGYRAIDYKLVTPYLVRGWQNHESRIERLERENKELKAEINRLKANNYGNC